MILYVDLFYIGCVYLLFNILEMSYTVVYALVFNARCYASTVLAMALCLSVRPSQVGVLLQQLNVGSRKQQHTIVQGL